MGHLAFVQRHVIAAVAAVAAVAAGAGVAGVAGVSGVSAVATGCGGRAMPASSARPPQGTADPHSHARADRTAVSHLALDVAVDFKTRQIAGTAALTVERRVPGAELILDTDGLEIAAATECGTNRSLAFTLGARHPVLGVPLTVALPVEVTCVAIRYRTATLEERFDRLAFQSTDSRAFVADTVAHLGGAGSGSRADPTDLKAFLEDWIHGAGVPAGAVPDSSALATRIRDAARAFAATGAAFDPTSWKTLEWVSFLRSLPEQTSIERLRALDQSYHLTRSPNSQILMYWLPILIAHDERAAVPAIDRFLGNVGRRWMVREVYAALVKKGGFWLDHGRVLFASVAPRYHPVTRDSIANLLAGKKS